MKPVLLWTSQGLSTAVWSQLSSFGGLHTPPPKAQRHPKQALKGRSTELTADLQPPHLPEGRAGRDDVVLSHLLQPLAGPPTCTGCFKFSSHVWQPGAAVRTTGLLRVLIQNKGDTLPLHCWSLFGLHSLPLTGVPWSWGDSPYPVPKGRFPRPSTLISLFLFL